MGANLCETDLREVNLRGADLRDADLRGADLRRAIFDERQIAYLKRYLNLEGTKVYIKETSNIISYEEYCMKKISKWACFEI